VAALYQVGAILRTLDEAADAGDAFATEAMVTQIDGLIMSAIGGLEGSSETEMVRRLLGLRDAFTRRAEKAISDQEIADAQAHAMREVNAYFERVLLHVPSIKAFIEGVAAARR
jgi:hypothetical protein